MSAPAVPGIRLAALFLAGAMIAWSAPGRADPGSGSRADLEQRVRELEKALQQLQRRPPAASAGAPEASVDADQVKTIVHEEIEKRKPLAGWDKGFYLQSRDGDYKLKLRGYAQVQARWFPNFAGDTNTTTFFLRRVRPIVEGTVARYVNFKIMPDFGQGQTTLQDAYLDAVYFPEASMRAGKYKVPFSLERLQSGASLLFVDRSLAQSLAPNRDVGFMLHGDLLGGALGYELGIFNGTIDGESSDGDLGGNKDFAGRVFAHPFKHSDLGWLKGLGVGVAGTYGTQDGDELEDARVRTAGRATIFRYASGVQTDGVHSRVDPQMYYFHGPFSLMFEYISSSTVGSVTAESGALTKGTVTNDGWYVQSTYVLTGEDASYKQVVPRHPFDPLNGAWGAFEVGFRVSQVDIDGDAFSLGFADPTRAVTGATAYTAGLNWYFNENFKLQLNYDRTAFDDSVNINGAFRSREDVILAQLQVAY